MDITKVAKRLKELREERKLSHKTLSEKLSQEYGITITDKQLMNYEAAAKDQYHTKANSISGMAINKLFALASFYDVSTDYILGFTDVRSNDPTIKAISEYTGLTKQTIDKFHTCVEKEETLTFVINLLMGQHGNQSLFFDWVEYYLLSKHIISYREEEREIILEKLKKGKSLQTTDLKKVDRLFFAFNVPGIAASFNVPIQEKTLKSFFVQMMVQNLEDIKCILDEDIKREKIIEYLIGNAESKDTKKLYEEIKRRAGITVEQHNEIECD